MNRLFNDSKGEAMAALRAQAQGQAQAHTPTVPLARRMGSITPRQPRARRRQGLEELPENEAVGGALEEHEEEADAIDEGASSHQGGTFPLSMARLRAADSASAPPPPKVRVSAPPRLAVLLQAQEEAGDIDDSIRSHPSTWIETVFQEESLADASKDNDDDEYMSDSISSGDSGNGGEEDDDIDSLESDDDQPIVEIKEGANDYANKADPKALAPPPATEAATAKAIHKNGPPLLDRPEHAVAQDSSPEYTPKRHDNPEPPSASISQHSTSSSTIPLQVPSLTRAGNYSTPTQPGAVHVDNPTFPQAAASSAWESTPNLDTSAENGASNGITESNSAPMPAILNAELVRNMSARRDNTEEVEQLRAELKREQGELQRLREATGDTGDTAMSAEVDHNGENDTASEPPPPAFSSEIAIAEAQVVQTPKLCGIPRKFVILAALVLLAVVVSVILAVTLSGDDGTGNNDGSESTTNNLITPSASTSAPTPGPKDRLLSLIQRFQLESASTGIRILPAFLDDYSSDNDLDNTILEQSTEYQAIEWMANNDPANLDLETLNIAVLVERYVMTLLFYQTTGWNTAYPNGHTWLSQEEVCAWVNTCNSDGGVFRSLGFERKPELIGTLPTEIGLLTRLYSLVLDETAFQGSIPTEIGYLTELSDLHLTNSYFSGTVPSELGLLARVNVINLSYNFDITGTVPVEIASLSNLFEFWIESTDISDDLSELFCLSPGEEIPFIHAECLGENSLVVCTCCSTCCSGNECCDYALDGSEECSFVV